MGEISNKNAAGTHAPVSDKEVKKLVAGLQKKASVKDVSKPQIPRIEVMDTDQRHTLKEQQEVSSGLPEGVLDIDGVEEDQMNPQLCVEYAPAIYSYLREVEEGLSIRKDFLQG